MEEEDIMDAIIYTTNTGSTERYARLLSHETGLPAYPAANAGEVCLCGCGGHLYGLDHGRFRQGLCRGGAAAKIVTMELARIPMK